MNGKREKTKSVLALFIEIPNLKNQRKMDLQYFKKYFSSLAKTKSVIALFSKNSFKKIFLPAAKILFGLIRKPIKFATNYT